MVTSLSGCGTCICMRRRRSVARWSRAGGPDDRGLVGLMIASWWVWWSRAGGGVPRIKANQKRLTSWNYLQFQIRSNDVCMWKESSTYMYAYIRSAHLLGQLASAFVRPLPCSQIYFIVLDLFLKLCVYCHCTQSPRLTEWLRLGLVIIAARGWL